MPQPQGQDQMQISVQNSSNINADEPDNDLSTNHGASNVAGGTATSARVGSLRFLGRDFAPARATSNRTVPDHPWSAEVVYNIAENDKFPIEDLPGQVEV